MKTQRFRATATRSLQDILEECQMIGYDAEIDGDEVVVYYGQRPKKAKKKAQQQQKPEQWSKRERNFGYTRG